MHEEDKALDSQPTLMQMMQQGYGDESDSDSDSDSDSGDDLTEAQRRKRRERLQHKERQRQLVDAGADEEDEVEVDDATLAAELGEELLSTNLEVASWPRCAASTQKRLRQRRVCPVPPCCPCRPGS